MIYVLLVPQSWATCGGGGGGGTGGMGGGSSQQTYQVPWKLITPAGAGERRPGRVLVPHGQSRG